MPACGVLRHARRQGSSASQRDGSTVTFRDDPGRRCRPRRGELLVPGAGPQARKRNRLDLEELGQSRLVDPLAPCQVEQHLALRPGQTQRPLGPLVEALVEKPRGVREDETEGALEIIVYHERQYNEPA